MVCSGLEIITDNTIIGLLTFPLTCDYYFYAKIMAAFFVVVSLGFYYADKDRFIKADMISSMGVGAIATIFVSLMGTTLEIIQPDIFITIFVLCMIFIVIWLLKK